MALDLSSYRAVQTANFVKISGTSYPTLLFSDDTKTRTISGETYTNIGQLLYIGSTRSEIRALEQTVDLGISGIPAGSIAQFLNTNYKGCGIEIRQAFFNPTTDAILSIAGNPLIKFKGLITNFGMEESWDNPGKTQTFTIVLQCSSLVSTVLKKVNGRRTNDSDQQALYPNDLSMSRVSTVTKSQFQFGKAGGATT